MIVDSKEKHSGGWLHAVGHIVKADGQVLVKTGREVSIQDEIDLALIVSAGGLLRSVRCLMNYFETKDAIYLDGARNEAEKALARYDGLVSDIENDYKVMA